jgi:hypothetical protein
VAANCGRLGEWGILVSAIELKQLRYGEDEDENFRTQEFTDTSFGIGDPDYERFPIRSCEHLRFYVAFDRREAGAAGKLQGQSGFAG